MNALNESFNFFPIELDPQIILREKLHHLYLFMSNGTCIFDYSFKQESRLEAQLVSGGLTGVFRLINEITRNKTKIKIVEQEEITILFEYGKYICGALITEENTPISRQKLAKLIQEVEEIYQEELEEYDGNIGIFSKIGRVVQKIFRC